MRVANQYTLDEEGDRILKRHVTHDCRLPPLEGESINDRVIDDLLYSCAMLELGSEFHPVYTLEMVLHHNEE